MDAIVKFKYHLLDANGNATGFMATKGQFDGEYITLGKEKIPAQAILKCLTVSNRLILVLMGEKGPVTIPMQISGGKAQSLNQSFNMIASVYQTQAHREMLEKAGRGHEFRSESCPHCRCMVDVTGMPGSPQLHCPFCDRLATLGEALAEESTHQLCSVCGLYSQPKMFSIAYFYFLLVVYGYSYRRSVMCNACARPQAWKMLFGNLLFVLLVPMAIVQLVRAYAGGAARSAAFPGLDSANALQASRKYAAAVREYERIGQRTPGHAGILYNHARALQRSAQVREAAEIYERATAACSNFAPAAKELLACYQQLGRTEDAARLKALWDEEGKNDESAEAPVRGAGEA